jgi:Rieske Fe-S protein
MEAPRKVSRRDATKAVIGAIGGLIGAALGIPAVAFLIGPALRREESDWIRLGRAAAIEQGTPALFKPRLEIQNGWLQENREVGVYVLTEDGREYHALSNICTHLGCRVRWIAEQRQFFSPCHNGVFDEHGYVVSGPPPRPLDEFATKVEEGDVFIRVPAVRRG